MRYTVYTKARRQTATRYFESLEEAIKYCKTHRTKYGHTVEAFCEWQENGKTHVGSKVLYED